MSDKQVRYNMNKAITRNKINQEEEQANVKKGLIKNTITEEDKLYMK
jgi:hypothetical protein